MKVLNSENKINNNYNKDIFNILCKAKNNNKNAIPFLIEKYQPLIRKYAFKYKIKNFDKEDLIQIGNISLITAINKYDLSKGNEYIDSYIINSIKNTFKNLARNQIKYNNESSLNISIYEDTEIADMISDSFSLEEHIINSDTNNLLKNILKTLPPNEYKLIKISYLTPNITLYRYCINNNLNYPKKRRELISIINKLYTILKD
ncbi:sigma-70 family RNA polymerase sigma factor [Clostridium sp.]|uniref:sigma-70 family RNA polymerase sigma factor n=1 Tax=Clostridium sp. TaxID=1506 RepID=UPI0025B8048F|nr:sigma-70 family RNA polymerase sigma factor [Clostridium sp.]MCI9303213.1 sigma-70 family RNA polymerase sigma factor [Clostridium sp.]